MHSVYTLREQSHSIWMLFSANERDGKQNQLNIYRGNNRFQVIICIAHETNGKQMENKINRYAFECYRQCACRMRYKKRLAGLLWGLCFFFVTSV